LTNIGSWNEQLSWGGHEPELHLTDSSERSLFPHGRTQSASAGPEPLLHETLSASPSFETETAPPVQVIEASVSLEPQVRTQFCCRKHPASRRESLLTRLHPRGRVALVVRAGPADLHRLSGHGDLVAPQHLLLLWALLRPLLLSAPEDLVAPAGLLPPLPLAVQAGLGLLRPLRPLRPWNALIAFSALRPGWARVSRGSLRPLRSRNPLLAFCALRAGRPLLTFRSWRTLFSFRPGRGFRAGHKRQAPRTRATPTTDFRITPPVRIFKNGPTSEPQCQCANGGCLSGSRSAITAKTSCSPIPDPR
jgi:hypothetical protein